MNLLSQRIKEAKRELTALKTAHKRGLGNLIVFNKYCEEMSTHQSTPLTITINFDTKYAPYPLFQVMLSGSATRLFGGQNVSFSNNGYQATSVVYEDLAFFMSYGFYVLSTAPVESISYRY